MDTMHLDIYPRLSATRTHPRASASGDSSTWPVADASPVDCTNSGIAGYMEFMRCSRPQKGKVP